MQAMGYPICGGCSADECQHVNHHHAPFSTAHAHSLLRDEPPPQVVCCDADDYNLRWRRQRRDQRHVSSSWDLLTRRINKSSVTSMIVLEDESWHGAYVRM